MRCLIAMAPVVLSVASSALGETTPVISFAGVKWAVKTSSGQVGPGPNVFGAENVYVDGRGHLHLKITRRGDQWICSEVVSQRSFGYGLYRFVVRDVSTLDINAVLGLFLWDSTKSTKDQYHGEVDIEVSRWADKDRANAQFVVQPHAQPGNTVQFELPPGRAELSFAWRPRELVFRAVVTGRTVREHRFIKGVPRPSAERVRMNAWLFRSPPAGGQDIELVIESFKFERLR